jgi:hypothetical protein
MSSFRFDCKATFENLLIIAQSSSSNLATFLCPSCSRLLCLHHSSEIMVKFAEVEVNREIKLAEVEANKKIALAKLKTSSASSPNMLSLSSSKNQRNLF